MGQSFTAGLTGPLSRVSVGITISGTMTEITAAIYATIPGTNTATGSALASKTIPYTSVPTTRTVLTAFDFVSPVSITAGTKYVIVLSTPDSLGSFNFGSSQGDSYAGGIGISRAFVNNYVAPDFVFQTYVDI